MKLTKLFAIGHFDWLRLKLSTEVGAQAKDFGGKTADPRKVEGRIDEEMQDVHASKVFMMFEIIAKAVFLIFIDKKAH